MAAVVTQTSQTCTAGRYAMSRVSQSVARDKPMQEGMYRECTADDEPVPVCFYPSSLYSITLNTEFSSRNH